MSREFGLYPTNREPQMWIGCRAIITERRLDVPYDRWSRDIKYESGKDDFIWWINNVAIPRINAGLKEGRKAFWFGSENGLFTCEADDRDSGGYLYCGFYSTKKYDEMIKKERMAMSDAELWTKAQEQARQEYEEIEGDWEEADKYEKQDWVFSAYMKLKEEAK